MVQTTPSEDFLIFKSKSVISVMMIIALFFNRCFVARNSLMTDLGLSTNRY